MKLLNLVKLIFALLLAITALIIKTIVNIFQWVFKNPKLSVILLAIGWLMFIISVCATATKPAIHATQVQAQFTSETDIINNKPTSRRRLNSNRFSQRYISLAWESREDRIQSLLQAYGFNSNDVRPAVKTIARIHRVYPEVILCIAYADSSLGKNLKTKHNYGNVGNNDRGDTQAYANLEQWLNAIGKVLNNRYLGDYISIDQLSRAGNKTGMVYATSDENWNLNVLNCLGMIRNKEVPSNFAFRF